MKNASLPTITTASRLVPGMLLAGPGMSFKWPFRLLATRAPTKAAILKLCKRLPRAPEAAWRFGHISPNPNVIYNIFFVIPCHRHLLSSIGIPSPSLSPPFSRSLCLSGSQLELLGSTSFAFIHSVCIFLECVLELVYQKLKVNFPPAFVAVI